MYLVSIFDMQIYTYFFFCKNGIILQIPFCNLLPPKQYFINIFLSSIHFFFLAQMVKNLPAMQQNWVQSLVQEDLLEEGMATHSGVLAWRIP